MPGFGIVLDRRSVSVYSYGYNGGHVGGEAHGGFGITHGQGSGKGRVMGKRGTGSVGLLVAVLVTITISAMALAEDSPREIAKRVSPSVVLLVMEDANGQPLAMGSGFVVLEGVVATNMHVIEGAARGYAKLVDQKAKYDVAGVVASDPTRDLVLLAVSGLKATSVTIGDSSQVAVGDDVFAVGNPRGLEGTFSAGIVSSIRKVGEDSVLQITAPISPGSSGGPVVNSKGEVIGVAVATFKGGQNLNFAIPSRYLSAMIPGTEALVALPKAAESSKARKSILYEMGGRSTEGVSVAQFSWDSSTGNGSFSLSLRNNLRDAVRGVYCLAIFSGNDGGPIDIALVEFGGVIPAGLAKRVTGRVDESVEMLNTPEPRFPYRKPPVPAKGRIEFRVLYFDIVNPDEPAGKGDGSKSERAPFREQGDARHTDPASSETASPATDQGAAAKLAELEKRLAEIAAKRGAEGVGAGLRHSWAKSAVIPVVLVKPGIGGFEPVEGSSIGNRWTRDEVKAVILVKPGIGGFEPVSGSSIGNRWTKDDLLAVTLVEPSPGEFIPLRLLSAQSQSPKAVLPNQPADDGPYLIESSIEGEFKGWDGETIFKLDNGQIWQQAGYAYTYRYAFRPKVMIIKTDGGYRMKVDGVSGTIFVKRLK